MNLGTFDLYEMAAAIARAMAHLKAARDELSPYMVVLTPEQRKELVKAPLRLNKVAREIVQAAEGYPQLLAACPKFSGSFVINRLESAELIAGISNQAEDLARLADDSYQTWLGEAYTSTLSVYRVGKAMAEDDPELRVVIQPMAEVYAARRAKKENDPG